MTTNEQKKVRIWTFYKFPEFIEFYEFYEVHEFCALRAIELRILRIFSLRILRIYEIIASSINYEFWSFEYYELAHAAQYKYSKIYWRARLQIHKFARSAIIG